MYAFRNVNLGSLLCSLATLWCTYTFVFEISIMIIIIRIFQSLEEVVRDMLDTVNQQLAADGKTTISSEPYYTRLDLSVTTEYIPLHFNYCGIKLLNN